MRHFHWLCAKPIAHRGLHNAKLGLVENSVSAAKAAIAKGFAIECDVQWARDGEAVVFHDFTLDRLTKQSGKLSDFSAKELAGIEMKGSADRIPTLSAFIDLLAGQIPLIIEIKSAFNHDLRLADRTAGIVAKAPKHIAIKSFDAEIVARIGEKLPETPRGFIGMNSYEYEEFAHLTAAQKHALANLLHYEAMRPDFLSWNVKDLPCAVTYLARKAIGLPVMSWTVRSAEDQRNAALHADQMVFEGFLPQA